MKVLGEVDVESGVPAHTVVWRDLVAAALLGTDRREWAPLATGTGLDSLLADLPASSPAGAVLGAAGALALYHHAGEMAATDERPLPDAAPEDDVPRCSREAAALLTRIFNGERRDLLDPWIELCGASQQRAAEEHLEALLDYGRAYVDGRAAIVRAIGGRGRWLATQNKAWDYAAPVSAEDSWENSSGAIRAAALNEIRQNDPAHARELLVDAFGKESAHERATLLKAMTTGLSMADEPFLEQCLDDRSSDVRDVAADLLAELSDSRLVGRMIERAQPLLSFKRQDRKMLGVRLGATATLEVTMPAPPDKDKAALRDGIKPKLPAHATLGKLLGSIPPRFWSHLWQVSPAEIVIAADKSDQRDYLLRAWSHAAIRDGDTEWVEALLAPAVRFSYLDAPRIITILPHERRERLTLEHLRSIENKLVDDYYLFQLLSFCRPWSLELSRSILAATRKAVAAKNIADGGRLKQTLVQFAYSIDPALLAEIERNKITTTAGPHIAAMIDEFVATLSFRKDLLLAFPQQH